MARYSVVIAPHAERALRKIQGRDYERLRVALLSLADEPRPANCKRMKRMIGRDAWRIRVGDYRIIYTITDNALLVTVISIGHRREVYKPR